MQIIPFPAHYQSVYTNFDISSFSRISCTTNQLERHHDKALFAGPTDFFVSLGRTLVVKTWRFLLWFAQKIGPINGHLFLHVVLSLQKRNGLETVIHQNGATDVNSTSSPVAGCLKASHSACRYSRSARRP